MAADQPSVTILTEKDTPSGWQFDARLSEPGEPDRTVTLRLSWADFEHWSGGAIPPSVVAKAVVELAMERKPASARLGDFDAAMLRRWFPGTDEVMQQELRGKG